MFILFIMLDILKIPFLYLEYYMRGHEVLVRRTYHWIVIVSFTMICFAEPTDSFSQQLRSIENRVTKMEIEISTQGDVLGEYIKNYGHPVVRSRLEMLEDNQKDIKATQKVLVSTIDEWSGAGKGIILLFTFIQIILGIIGTLGYRRIKDIDDVVRKYGEVYEK